MMEDDRRYIIEVSPDKEVAIDIAADIQESGNVADMEDDEEEAKMVFDEPADKHVEGFKIEHEEGLGSETGRSNPESEQNSTLKGEKENSGSPDDQSETRVRTETSTMPSADTDEGSEESEPLSPSKFDERELESKTFEDYIEEPIDIVAPVDDVDDDRHSLSAQHLVRTTPVPLIEDEVQNAPTILGKFSCKS